MILDAASEAKIRTLLREAQLREVDKNVNTQIALIKETMQYVPDNLSHDELLSKLQQVTSEMNSNINAAFTALSKDIGTKMEAYFGKH